MSQAGEVGVGWRANHRGRWWVEGTGGNERKRERRGVGGRIMERQGTARRATMRKARGSVGRALASEGWNGRPRRLGWRPVVLAASIWVHRLHACPGAVNSLFSSSCHCYHPRERNKTVHERTKHSAFARMLWNAWELVRLHFLPLKSFLRL